MDAVRRAPRRGGSYRQSQRDEREGARAGEVDKRPGLGLVIEGAQQDPVGGEDREREREHQEQPVPGFAPEAQGEERDGVGALTGFFGVGGGFVIVPVLTLWFGVTFRRAVATSLVIITLTGVAALVSHLAAGGTPDLPITAALAGSTAVGALCGTLVAQRLPQRALGRAFALVVAAVAVFLLVDTVALGGPPGH
jgi:uncharacterized membrane protein YfcA